MTGKITRAERRRIKAAELMGWSCRVVSVEEVPDLRNYTDEPWGWLITSPDGRSWGGSLDIPELQAKLVYYPEEEAP